MSDIKQKILFVNSEIYPYLPESDIAHVGRYLPQGTQERKREIRSFMPRYGCINERKNQLHEVIRLSGMNIIIAEVDRPLIIKVASISSARIQVYFIDNEDYFRRKQTFCDASGKAFEDNDERTIFFARGVLETVKKLRWRRMSSTARAGSPTFSPPISRKPIKTTPSSPPARLSCRSTTTPRRSRSTRPSRRRLFSAASPARTCRFSRTPLA